MVENLANIVNSRYGEEFKKNTVILSRVYLQVQPILVSNIVQIASNLEAIHDIPLTHVVLHNSFQ